MELSIETARLVLQPMSRAELAAKQAAEPDPEMQTAYGEMLAIMDALPGREYWGGAWRIALRGGAAVGDACFKGAPDELGQVELGYGIDEAFRRQGYAAEAAAALTEWALGQPGVRRVLAQTEPGNEVSRRVLLKCGFVRHGDGPEGPMYWKERA